MKKIVNLLLSILIVFTLIGAKPIEGENRLTSNYDLKEMGVLWVNETFNLENKLKDKTVIREISINNDEDVYVKNIKVTTEDNKIFTLYKEDLDSDNYITKKEDSKYTIAMNIKEYGNVRNVEIEYEIVGVNNRFVKDNNNAYLKLYTYGNDKNTIKVNSESQNFWGRIVGYWTNSKGISESEYSPSIKLETGENSYEAMVAYPLDNYILKKNTFKSEEGIEDALNNNYTKLYSEDITSYNDNNIGFAVIVFFVITVAIIIGIVLAVISASKKKQIAVKESNKKRVETVKKKRRVSKKEIVVPQKIYPAYLSVLFNQREESLIFIVLLELIRKGALIIKLNSDELSNNGKRKYILALTELEVELEGFEVEFIKLIREMDDIYLINLADLNGLLWHGYFRSIKNEINSNFKEMIRKDYSKDMSLEELTKLKDLEGKKWLEFREVILYSSWDKIEDMTVEDIEKLHVLSEALGVRKVDFPLFSMYNSRGLLMSEYFESIMQSYDDGESVLGYLETIFLVRGGR